MTHPTRVSPVDHRNLSPRQTVVSAKMGKFGTPDASNLMRTMLNYPEFARSIGRLSTRVTLTTSLPSRLYQLACMRTVWLCDSEYLWARHRDECLALGITEDELHQVALGPVTGTLQGLDRLIIEAVDEMHYTHYLWDGKWTGFDRFGPNAVMDVMSTYGFYVTMAAFCNSTGVALEDGFAGWSPALLSLKAADQTGHKPPQPGTPLPGRVTEADYAALTPEQQEQANRMGRRGLPSTSKLQKCMINYVDFLKAIAPFGKRAIDDTSLPPRVWQLACMRTVWLCDSEYLWSQHRKACLKLGVTDEDLLGVAEGPRSTRLNGFDRVVVAAIDELYYQNRLSDAHWGQFDQFGPEGVTDLMLVYGLYIIQSCVARNFGTTLEPNSLGYLPELEPLRAGQQR
ncbi:carboxymuconolactone decarboxylase family protein [Niveispirillum fermenti]|uniref:carboxymuconolactone decarboxylase family protein n=1 Tax=Niveispirillum fermenti TaxID=1233113 RepID=UPI003A84C050